MKAAQSYPTLWDTMDYTVHGILQARVLEWVTFPFSRGFPNLGLKPGSPVLQADSLPTELQITKGNHFLPTILQRVSISLHVVHLQQTYFL